MNKIILERSSNPKKFTKTGLHTINAPHRVLDKHFPAKHKQRFLAEASEALNYYDFEKIGKLELLIMPDSSMWPEIEEGGLILISKGEKLSSGDKFINDAFYLCEVNGMVLVRRIIKTTEIIQLQPENINYGISLFRNLADFNQQVKIQARVLANMIIFD